MSHLTGTSDITTRANRQFPRPDFHRLDTQPYGLHANIEHRTPTGTAIAAFLAPGRGGRS